MTRYYPENINRIYYLMSSSVSVRDEEEEEEMVVVVVGPYTDKDTRVRPCILYIPAEDWKVKHGGGGMGDDCCRWWW